LDEHAAWHRHHAALRQRVHCTNEIALLLCTLEQRPRTDAHRKCAIGLPVSDFKAQEADAVLGCGDLKATARIEHGNDDRLKVLLNGLRESSIENLAGDGQGQSSQRGFFQCSFWVGSQRGETCRRWACAVPVKAAQAER
jgi:hypothetical protein